MGVIEDKSITYSKLADDVAESITATMTGSAPDWRAQEGEAGHIKNKPFRFIDGYGKEYKFTNPLKVEDFTPMYDEEGEWGELRIYKKPIDAGSIKFVVSNKSTSWYGDICETPYIPLPERDNKYRVDLSDYSGYVYIERGDEYNWLVVEMDYADCFFPENTVYVIDEYDDDLLVEKIPELCLPNTVLKTTPQTLSDAEKNQALTNLGIDPVVWKYMCNPLVISVGDTVPEELLGSKYIYGDNTYYKIKYPNRAMYKYKYISVSEDDSGYVLMDLNTINNQEISIDQYVLNSEWVGISICIDEDKRWIEL